MRGGTWVVAVLASALALGACGGGARQDASEPKGEYRLDIVRAEFPSAQTIAQRSRLVIEVRNSDTKTVPDLAVTIKTRPGTAGDAPIAFGQRLNDPRLADPARPIWIVDRAPTGGQVAYTNTWALGPVPPGQSRRFEWHVTAVKSGDFELGYEVAPGLQGKARLPSGSTATSGSFKIKIDQKPPAASVDANGNVVRAAPGSGK